MMSRYEDFLEAYTKVASEKNLVGSELDETITRLHAHMRKLVEDHVPPPPTPKPTPPPRRSYRMR
jgi:hypothetical protein